MIKHFLALGFIISIICSLPPKGERVYATSMPPKVKYRIPAYVDVTLETDASGKTLPREIVLEGRVWKVSACRDSAFARDQETGFSGTRYQVLIWNTWTYLFFENPRWFVLKKIYEEESRWRHPHSPDY